ncbi:AAA family ATPase [Nodosilinea sp. LEGE 07088]|uniref:phosphorylase family protein n=1 Tax=Nodosilinea sp. LEGE 07088 TaxID=2777968 RepID=UPI0018808316|nr:AAA family ATPase [Nodosilinea sp. LEGE 07088]MBE9139464.1 AAA family ATPase [Nodosilinea sp. LEGE 07088]
MPRAIILTSHPDEYNAVRAYLTELEENTHSQGTVYGYGKFSTDEQTWEVALAEIAPGNTDAALETERAIAHWQPNIVLSVGVATGLKDVNAGDVVAGIKVYGYESGKETESGFSTRPEVGLASYPLEQRAKATARQDDWLERIQEERANWTSKAVVGVIAAGEKEIASTQSETYQLLQASYGDALAVDTSGYGVLRAVHANANTNALIIRGISHVIDQEVTINSHAARVIAAKHASAFAFELLAKLGDAKSFGLSPAQYGKLKEGIALASKGLLNWKRTLINDEEIERPEFNELLNRIQTAESSTTILLGPPGSGKSALMAALGNYLISQDHAVLAIKADQLSGSIQSVEDLQRDLRLDFPPDEAIYAIASEEPIVVLIDQLDAVSELLDRRSERLTLLLALIQRLSESKNVHIVATCREFEFRYGSQFARLAGIEQMTLSLLPWEKMSPILEIAGHEPEKMGESLRELLQTPLHLNIFLDIAQPGELFTSSQNLLDRLWEERVLKQSEPEQCVAFLEELANEMTEDEILWVPRAFIDKNPAAWKALEQVGLLISNPENSTIGFRHQTYYDHTLARSFARGTQSLTELVLDRQDGLFVRPILLRGLNYLRGTALHQYQRQLTNLLQTYQEQVRPHIRSLLIGFVGAQREPNSVEAVMMIPLLNLELEGIKVLDAMVGSLGWFKRLCNCPEFTQWLEKPAEQALYCSNLLAVANNFASEDVWQLLEDYWLEDPTHDPLSLRIIWDISDWTPERVGLVQQVIQRNYLDWHTVASIAEKIAETLPDQFAKVIRSHLDYLLAQAIEASKIEPPALPPEADETERVIHDYQHNPLEPLLDLFDNDSRFYEIEKFAEANPQGFLNSMWPWFIEAVQLLAYERRSFVVSYLQDRIGDFKFLRSEIIQSLLAAIKQLAKESQISFIAFLEQNEKSELLIIHRLLAHGLETIAEQEPQLVLNYLLADERRLNLGGQTSSDRATETETLISAIFPCLQPDDRDKLEIAIKQLTCYLSSDIDDIDLRRRCLQYNREHRLSLLTAIPKDNRQPELERFIEEENRALPWFDWNKENNFMETGFIGARMTKEEMSRASDDHLLNLFNELPDQTEWGYPQRRSSHGISRAGGAVQQSREFGELVKDNPERLLRLLPKLEPQKHESYVGDAVEDLAGTNFPANELVRIIEELDQRGFSSEDFRSETASALEKIAKRDQGLSKATLGLLERWLLEHSKPELEHHRSGELRRSNSRSPILFNVHSSHTLPHGRGNIVRAIAEGHLNQEPPDLEGWATFIKSQIGKEPHPAVWVDILQRMPPLLNGDREEATVLFDQVIRNCPEILQYSWALYFISHTIGWFEPKETVQTWLDLLENHASNFSLQAYGELLLIQHLQYQDEWSKNRIEQHLRDQSNDTILCGLAHAASHLWSQRRCRKISVEILCTLANSSNKSIQRAVSNFFRWNRDNFRLDSGTSQIIQAVCQNQEILLESANDLIDIVEEENLVEYNPQIVVEICSNLLAIGSELTNPAKPTALIAESLTTISIQLHRRVAYREVGLQLFESLLDLNLRETQAALETLDRRPFKSTPSLRPPRRRLRRRQKE